MAVERVIFARTVTTIILFAHVCNIKITKLNIFSNFVPKLDIFTFEMIFYSCTISIYNLQIVIAMLEERNLVFVARKTVYVYVRKDMVAADATSVSQAITAILTVDHAIVACSVHHQLPVMPLASVRVLPILLERPAISAVQGTINIRNVSVCNKMV